MPWFVVAVAVVMGVGGMLAGCGGDTPDPTPISCTDDLPPGIPPTEIPQIVSFDAFVGEVGIDAWGKGMIHLGHPPESGNPYGVVFRATVMVPEGVAGYIEFAQVGIILSKWQEAERCCYRGFGSSWKLDADPYPMLTEAHSFDNFNDPDRPKYEYENSRYVNTKSVKNSSFIDVETGDAPAEFLVPFGHGGVEQVTVEEQYEMYLMWRPDGGGDRVALGVINWGWIGKAKRLTDGGWSNLSESSKGWKDSWKCATGIREVSGNLSDLVKTPCQAGKCK
jgi:hypothetical protein